MRFESDKEFTNYVEQSVNNKIEKHFEALGNQIVASVINETGEVPFSQSQVDFIASLAHNYGKAGAKFGALTALEMVQQLNQPH